MRRTAPQFKNLESSITTSELADGICDWLNDSEIRQLSPRTIEERRYYTDKLLWFLRHRSYDSCGVAELRGFFVYLRTGHQENGRWENAHRSKALCPITIRSYYTQYRVLFNWLVAEGVIEASPMERIGVPIARPDQIQPLSTEQVKALLDAAHDSKYRHRDKAIILFLLDTGARASEVCGLRMRDIDLGSRTCTVTGKGNKRRQLYFGRQTTIALRAYLRQSSREQDDPVFLSERGTYEREPLSRSGLLQIVQRLGQVAGVKGARCSPHTFRHTFAIDFLRNGGNLLSLQRLLGHASLHMTNRYVALGQTDLAAQHRQFSPADRLTVRSR